MAFFKKIKNKIAGFEAGIISVFLMAITGIFSAAFAGIWLSLLIGARMGSILYGFGIVAIIFTFIFLLVLLVRRKSIQPLIKDSIIESREQD